MGLTQLNAVGLWCILILLTRVAVFCESEQTGGSASTLGTQFSVTQDSNGTLYASGTLVDTDGTIQYNSPLSNDSFPYEGCGDRLWRCGVEVIKQNSEVITITPQTNGIRLSCYSELNSNNFSFEEEHLVHPQENINCTFASFARSDNQIYVLCLNFGTQPCFNPDDPNSQYEVNVWLFELEINFNALNESSLTLLNTNAPYCSYSTGLSRILFYNGDSDFLDRYIVWFDDGVLFVWEISSSPQQPVEYAAQNETTNVFLYECFGNNFTDVRLSADQKRLSVYCANNTLLTVHINERGAGYVPFDLTRTHFPCNESSYLEVRDGGLALVSPPQMDLIIPHPVNPSEIFKADCILIWNSVYFTSSSRDGMIVLTNVLENETTVLTTDTRVDHQVIEGRLVVYTNSTGQAILDLTCPFPSIPVFNNHQTYLLTAFEFDQSFICPQEEPPTLTDMIPTENRSHQHIVIGSTLGTVALLVLSGIIIVAVVIFKRHTLHCRNQAQRLGPPSSSDHNESQEEMETPLDDPIPQGRTGNLDQDDGTPVNSMSQNPPHEPTDEMTRNASSTFAALQPPSFPINFTRDKNEDRRSNASPTPPPHQPRSVDNETQEIPQPQHMNTLHPTIDRPVPESQGQEQRL